MILSWLKLIVIGQTLEKLGVLQVQWYLDAPVSNSGRLKGIMYEVAEKNNFQWQIDLDNNPDRILTQQDKIVISTDSWVLDNSKSWTNLAREIIENHIDTATIFESQTLPVDSSQ